MAATPKPVPVPPKPTGLTFSWRDVESDTGFVTTHIVTWRMPRTKGIEIRVYGVTECLSIPEDTPAENSGPCLVEHTPLPKAALNLIAKAKASDNVATWEVRDPSWPYCDGVVYLGPDGEVFNAIVLAAYGPSGHSVFAIAEPGLWYSPGYGRMDC